MIENLNKQEIKEALMTVPQQPVHSLDETIEELKKMGIRNINEIDDKKLMNDIAKNIQLTQVLNDKNNDKMISLEDILNKHITFLMGVSENKTKEEIISKLDVEHIQTIIKTTSKLTIDEQTAQNLYDNLKNR